MKLKQILITVCQIVNSLLMVVCSINSVNSLSIWIYGTSPHWIEIKNFKNTINMNRGKGLRRHLKNIKIHLNFFCKFHVILAPLKRKVFLFSLLTFFNGIPLVMLFMFIKIWTRGYNSISLVCFTLKIGRTRQHPRTQVFL